MNILEDGLVYINVMKFSNLYVTGCDQNSWKSRPNILHTQKAESICFFDRNSGRNSWSLFRRILIQFAFPSGLENEKDHQYSTFLFIHWQKNSWHQNSYGISAEEQMDSAYDFCEKMQNKTSNKTHMHKKCKTQVVHLKINPVFDTVKIITIYPSKQIFKGTWYAFYL